MKGRVSRVLGALERPGSGAIAADSVILSSEGEFSGVEGTNCPRGHFGYCNKAGHNGSLADGVETLPGLC